VFNIEYISYKILYFNKSKVAMLFKTLWRDVPSLDNY